MACSRCGRGVRNPGLSRAAWGGEFCGLSCAMNEAADAGRARLAQEAEVRRRVAQRVQSARARMAAEFEQRLDQERQANGTR